jgi:hypothetical protein
VQKYKNEVMTKQSEDGITTISNLSYDVDENNFVNVNRFNTKSNIDPKLNKIHDIRHGNMPFKRVNHRRGSMPMLFH